MIKKIVTIGAGTGQSAIVKGLMAMADIQVTSLVTVTDNGGSSALVREALGISSPGDVRNVMNAINQSDALLGKLLQYRFSEGELSGMHLGNLIVGALSRISGSYAAGIDSLHKELGLQARVLPISDGDVQVCAELVDGTHLVGEWQIVKRDKKDIPVKNYYLSEVVPALDLCIHALREADVIIVCPGVLGTGVLSPLLFGGVKDAMINTSAKLLYIANAMTYHSQTDDFTLSDHVFEVEKYTGRSVDIVVANTMNPPKSILDMYAESLSFPVLIDKENLEGYTLLLEDLLIDFAGDHGHSELSRARGINQHVGLHMIRHDGRKLISALKSVLSK